MDEMLAKLPESSRYLLEYPYGIYVWAHEATVVNVTDEEEVARIMIAAIADIVSNPPNTYAYDEWPEDPDERRAVADLWYLALLGEDPDGG